MLFFSSDCNNYVYLKAMQSTLYARDKIYIHICSNIFLFYVVLPSSRGWGDKGMGILMHLIIY